MVTGLVQGIGFRPFVAELAEEHHLSGHVKNLGGVVEIVLSGEKQAVDSLIHRLKFVEQTGELPGCRIDELICTPVETNGAEKKEENAFRIIPSGNGRETHRFLPVDMAVCDRCVEEMHDRKNRRYLYPFISCTACGPRFSIQKAVPYDRETITMDDFVMCEACRQEYTQKGNIRRHAQTIACPSCGPTLSFVTLKEGTKDFLQISDSRQAISEAVQALKEGQIGAIRDIGGYHFALSPFNMKAAQRLRTFKNRDKKPFAVMFLNLDEVQKYCEVSEKEAAILESSARPIVLLKKKKDFAQGICDESDRIGALLPCNPLQILLLEETGPLVMTSGNRGGEPIVTAEAEMQKQIGNGIDFMLTHDREILTPLDDSIYQVTESNVQCIRRARGLVPEPIRMNRKLPEETFAAGSDLKAVFALGKDDLVYLSQHFGDLEDVYCMQSRVREKARMEHLLEIHPKTSAGDMHPSYLSSQEGKVKIQHHHAHILSVIAEHGLQGKVLGIACDGTGYGTDKSIWGSEFLLCQGKDMERVGHFSSVKLLGGDASAKQADLTLFSYMLSAREKGMDVDDFFHVQQKDEDAQTIQNMRLQEMAWKQNINTVCSSSMGRLFDAAAALLDICHYNSYEGECAVLLEQAAHKGKEQLQTQEVLSLHYEKTADGWVADGEKLMADLYHLKAVYPKEVCAYLFHHAIAEGIVAVAEEICAERNVSQIALGGGTFLNRILLLEIQKGNEKNGRKTYINEKIPCGDGGIALGQMYYMTFPENLP